MGDTAAFVTLHRRENKSSVLSGTPMPLGTTIKPYATFLIDSRKGNDERCVSIKKRKVDAEPTSPPPTKSRRSHPIAQQKKSQFVVPNEWE